MNSVLKQLAFLVLIILAGLGIYFGAFLPLGKAQSFIRAQANLRLIKNTDDLQNLYDVPLGFSSPIGQEEVTKFTASTISDLVAGQNLDEPTARWLTEYIEPYLFKNDVRHLVLLGDMYRILWERYGARETDFTKSEEYFLKAYEIGPRLPPVLYRLTEMYLKHGDKENARRYGETILQYWNDEKVRAAIQ